jgi:hypothetical protein
MRRALCSLALLAACGKGEDSGDTSAAAGDIDYAASLSADGSNLTGHDAISASLSGSMSCAGSPSWTVDVRELGVTRNLQGTGGTTHTATVELPPRSTGQVEVHATCDDDTTDWEICHDDA